MHPGMRYKIKEETKEEPNRNVKESIWSSEIDWFLIDVRYNGSNSNNTFTATSTTVENL